ncbi:MAG: flavodoxin-dependent (E)-4-hydroxy-3-methylbut-2-enyl-diphosphate synthase [Candidatus Omnitrophota bacterium]|nr:flavodoxin-dependent (E)-4-hydroxy-3-methylbut-2-enyl-diphosphate synthase [Candidatus Omnitrophota bacterium]
MTRRKTRQVKVGNVKIGGNASVSIQSMAKFDTSNVARVVSQIEGLEKCGCEIIRVAVKTTEDAKAIKEIKKKIGIPLVADIHFDYRLALESIKSGADKIRLNPGNMKNRDEIAQVVRAAKKARIPIRIGVNSGSTSCDFVDSALKYVKLFEDLDFHDIIISLKGSDVSQTVEAYRRISKRCDYPLHLGVTASGPYDCGIIKSSIGIGTLLLDGIGDTIRVSLTAEPKTEVVAAKRILSSLGLRKFGPEIISCPTCGRCQVDLVSIVQELEDEFAAYGSKSKTKKPVTIAVMGCEVNGPGEASQADIGIAFGKGSGMLFKKGKIIRKVSVGNAIKELLKLL